MAPSERSALAFLHLEAAAGAPTAFKYLAMAAEASENTLGAHAARKGLLRATCPKVHVRPAWVPWGLILALSKARTMTSCHAMPACMRSTCRVQK